MHFNKKTIIFILNFFILMIVSYPLCHADIALNNEKDKAVISELSILESPINPGEFIKGDLSALGFVRYSSEPLPDTIKNEKKMYTFRGSFRVDPSLSKTLLSLYLGPCSYPYVVYINGVMVISRGSYGDYYQSSSYETLSVQLRGGLIRYGTNLNEIAIQAYPIQDFSPFYPPVLSSEENTSFWAFMRNLFNVYLSIASFVIGILIGLYFILLFCAHRFTERHYLYFAAMCIFFSFSYVNNSFTFNSVDEVFLERVSDASCPLMALFFTLFIRELTKILKRFWVLLVVTIPTLSCSLYVLSLNSKYGIDAFFNNYALIFIIAPLLIFSFIMLTISYIKTRKNNYLIILFAFLINIFTISHDIYYMVNYLSPYCWLFPYGFLALLISIFIVLAMEESNIYIEAIKRTKELDKKNESMKMVLQKLDTVSRNLIKSSSALKDNTEKTAFIIAETSKNNKVISGRLKTQLSEIEKVTSQIAYRMETSADKIPKAVSSQTAAVEETNRTVSGMNTHIEKILRSIIQTDNISRELSNIALNSKQIVMQSRDSVEKVSENTNYISEVLQTIQEIVEESNFLSVNASIESSYAGEAGQGFSILASEIRNLANKSKERLAMSQERLKQMNFNINESIKLTEEVASQLLTIIEKSGNSADMIGKISKLMYEHKLESNAIDEGTGTLLKDTLSIRDMTEGDYQESEKLHLTLITLKKSFEDMSRLISSHEQTENNIYKAIDHIQEVLSENLKTIEILKETFIIAGSDNVL